MTFASSQLDVVIGLDIHMELVPIAGVPTPVPFPMPYLGMIEFKPGGLLLSIGISALTSRMFGSPPTGPVLVNSLEATKTGDEATNKKTLPHVVLPPGVKWTPLPRPLKLKVRPPPPDADSPAAPPGDAIFITGSKTVLFQQSNACRLLDIAMSCGDPVRLPIATLIAVPKGLPVVVGGPPALDYKTAAKAFFLRNKWTAGLLREFAFCFSGRARSILGWAFCTLTGHPVDVGTGRLLTRAEEYVLRGPIPLTFERYYSSSWAERDSPLGYGWSHTFDERVWVERGRVVYKTGDGRELEFPTFDLPGRVLREGQELFYPIDRLWLRCEGQGRYRIRSADGLVREFATLAGDRSGESRLTHIRNPSTQWVRFQYDEKHCLQSVRTREGRWIRFEHDPMGKLKRVIVPVPNGGADAGWYDKVTFSYSANGDLVAATDSACNAKRYEYDAHLLVAETDRDDNVFYFQYDGRDSTARCIRTWGDDKKGCDNLYFRKITYDLANRRTFVEDSRKATTVYEMNELNAVVKTVDPHGATTTREFDEHSWLVAEVDALGQRATYAYDARGNQTERVLPNGATWRTEYNTDDKPVRTTDPVGVVSLVDYDTLSRVMQMTTSAGEATRIEYEREWPMSVTRSDGTTVRFERDELGQIIRTLFPDGSDQQRRYDRQGRVRKIRDGVGRVRRATFDLEGRLVRLEHAGGIPETFGYSREGDVVEAMRPERRSTRGYSHYHQLAWTEEAGDRVSFRRDAEGELSTVVNEAGEEYRFVRDACGRVAEEITFDDRKRTFIRDALGRVMQEFAPSQAGSKLEYDALSNVTKVTYSDGTEETYGYDVLGRLTSATNDVGTVRFERDARGRVLRESFGDAWVATTRDSLGRSTATRTSMGLHETIGRDDMGRVASINASSGWSARFERDAAGAEIHRLMVGGTEVWRSRDEAGRPNGLTVKRKDEVLAQTSYDWRGLDRLASKRDGVTGDVEEYVHDYRGRLAGARSAKRTPQWRVPGVTGDLYKTDDRSDRRYGKGGLLHQDRDTRYAYDANGNVVEKRVADGPAWRYRWSEAGRLMGVTTGDRTEVAFAYDALGRRVEKRVGARSTRWLWDGNVPVHEWTEGCGSAADKAELTTWLFGPGGFTPLGKIVQRRADRRGKAYNIVSDYIGTPQEMLDEAGRVAWKAQLDVYGVPTVEHGDTEDCPWRWPGQYEDKETGLFYNRFRYYDPERGGYLSQDPIRLNGGRTLYSYASDTLLHIDPLALTSPDEATTLLYRGVASTHPGFDAALQGVAEPRGGNASLVEHVLGDTRSPFTSWTTDLEVAEKFATEGYTTSGVVLSKSVPNSSIVPIPENLRDFMDESEMPVNGPVAGAQVTPVGCHG